MSDLTTELLPINWSHLAPYVIYVNYQQRDLSLFFMMTMEHVSIQTSTTH